MFFIKSDKQNDDAIQHIEDVLNAHVSMKKERLSEQKLINKKHIADNLKQTLEEYLEEEKKELDIKIAAIKYTLDYVKLMLKINKKHE